MRSRRLLNWIPGLTKRERARRRNRRAADSLLCEALEVRTMLTGVWTPLTNATLTGGSGTMILLSDGSVMAMGNGYSQQWQRLTPNNGNYAAGTWSAMPSMSTVRQHFPINVLPDGRVFVLGGEYWAVGNNKGQDTNTGEIYNPVSNSWTSIPNFPDTAFGDDPTMVLPDGRVLAGDINNANTYIYDPVANSWSSGGTKLYGDRSDEESWVKLPDGSVLTYDVFTQGATTGNAQRYIPSTNTWVSAGTVPVLLTGAAAPYNSELGPAVMLPDGRAFFIGATGHTAYYTPSTNSWAAGPDLPNGLGSDDEPAAVLPNGHVLIAAEVPFWNPPTHILDFDPTAGTYTDVTPPNYNMSFKGFHFKMLMLPTGRVLLSNSTGQLEIYTPDGGPQASWKPAITDIAEPSNGKFTLTGTQINGLSAGAAFGDDAEMDSNYPIIRLTNLTTSQVSFARTFNWSSTGVATGNTPETVNFTLPAGLAAGNYALRVSGSGISSAPVLFVLGSSGSDAITYTTFTSNSHEFSQVTRNATTQNINMSGFAGVYIAGGKGNDTINVRSTFNDHVLTIDGGSGGDTVNISSVAKNLNSIQGTVRIHGGGGSETLNVLDQANSAPVTYTMQTENSTSSLVRTGAAAISYDASVKSVVLNGGTGNDTYNVDGTLAGTQTKINGGTASDAFNIGPSTDNLDSIQGGVGIYGGGGSDSLTVDDQANAAPVTYGMALSGGSASSLARTGAAAISYDSSIKSVVLNGGSGADTYNVNDTRAGVATTLNGGTASDKFNISPTAQNLNNIQGAITIKGGGGGDALTVDDQANTAAVTYTMQTSGTSSSTLTRTGAAAVSYDSSVTSVTLKGGSGQDTYDVDGTLAGTATTLIGGAAKNTFNISPAAHDLGTIQGPVAIKGGSSGDTLNIDDQADTAAVTYPLQTSGTSASTLVRTGAATISYNASVKTVVLNGGTGNDVYNVDGTLAGVATTINGGPAKDTFNLSPTDQNLNSIQGAITIKGGGGGDALNVDDQANNAAVTYTMQSSGTSASTLVRTGAAAVSYDSSLTSMTLHGGSSADTYDMLGTLAGTATSLQGGSGNNDLVGPSGNSLWTINGPNAGTLQGPAPDSPVSFTGMPNLTGGSSNDLFRFVPGGSIAGFVNGGAGSNTLGYAANGGNAVTVNLATGKATATGGFAKIQNLVGSTSNADVLIGGNTTNTWSISAPNAGAVNGFSFTGIENLTGGTAHDVFAMGPGGSVSGKINGGGGGNDWLDYASVKTPVSADLTADTATGVAGGIAGIRNVRGGQGGNTLTGNSDGNILIGGLGNNTIVGGKGKSLLIGGEGTDKITGNSGGDILIAGYTNFDPSSTANDMALESILAEWRSGNSYPTRISHIKNGGGLNGSNKLVWGGTVHDNSTANNNTLTGGGGEGALNWFFANTSHTKTNRTPTEQLN